MKLDARGKVALGILGLATIGGLAGCATFGGNVRGNFSCQAPGGTCAPTSAIDDQALATIDQGGPAPAGNGGEGARFIRVSGDKVAAAPGRGLRIVLPARVDRYGHWREPQIVYADVSMSDLTYGAPAPQGGRLSLSELAAGAPGIAETAAEASTGIRAQTLSSNDALANAVRKAYSQGLQSGDAAVNPALDPAARQTDPARAPVNAGNAAKPAPLPVKVSAPPFPAAVEGKE